MDCIGEASVGVWMERSEDERLTGLILRLDARYAIILVGGMKAMG